MKQFILNSQKIRPSAYKNTAKRITIVTLQTNTKMSFSDVCLDIQMGMHIIFFLHTHTRF